MRLLTTSTIILALAAAVAAAPSSDDLGEPVRILADGKPIDVDVGHASPYLLDLDGDGKRDLLVGQFGGGKLRVYPNLGSEKDPRYASWSYLKSATADARVPSG